ncbi:MAG: hypothetical protein P8P79_11560 [Halioglobus sp.]|nr:hypothetical protein [Halioglobus sp.]
MSSSPDMTPTEASPEKALKDCASETSDCCEVGVWLPALKEAAVAFFAAALLLVVVYSIWFFDFHSTFQRFAKGSEGPELTLTGSHFVPVHIGDGGYKDGVAMIVEYLDGVAILEAKTAFQAEDYPFIAFDVEGLTSWSKAFVLWQLENDPGNVHSLQLNRSLGEVTQIAMPHAGSKYAGQVSTLAIGFFSDATDHDNNRQVLFVKGVTLKPFSAMRVAEQIFEDWTNPPLLKEYSNNLVRGIHATGIVPPNVVANLLVVTAVLLAWLWRLQNKRRGRVSNTGLLAVSLCLCLYGWAFNDVLRWHWRIAQLADSHERYADVSPEERIYNSAARCSRRDDCFEHLLPYF